MVVWRPRQISSRSRIRSGHRLPHRDHGKWRHIGQAYRGTNRLWVERIKLPRRRIIGRAEPMLQLPRPDISGNGHHTLRIVEGNVAVLWNPPTIHQNRRGTVPLQRNDLVGAHDWSGPGIPNLSTELHSAIKA